MKTVGLENVRVTRRIKERKCRMELSKGFGLIDRKASGKRDGKGSNVG